MGRAGAVPLFTKRFVIAGPFALLHPDFLLLGIVLFGFVFFLCATLFRIILILLARQSQPRPYEPEGKMTTWPTYTILIALKDEAAVIPQLAAAISRLEYPSEKLDLKLLIEDGDECTLQAIMKASWPSGSEVLVLPRGAPQTKPRALNYGLMRARGAFVVVYDAEDLPHPHQLKAAVQAFASGPTDLVCVQAPLVGQTSSPSWVARQWALEYAIQFRRVVVGLSRAGLPIALGGTSNHFRCDALRRVGGWDAWNVTEDADLGLRIARHGYKIGVLAEPTYERPPELMRVWLGQRSRWLKGYMQTWGVLMRDPAKAVREFGWIRFLAVQLTLGAAILAAGVHGPWAVWCIICLVWPEFVLGPFGASMFVVSITSGWLMAALSRDIQSSFGIWHILTQPVYWPLQSLAMGRAVYSLMRRPHFWAKTPH